MGQNESKQLIELVNEVVQEVVTNITNSNTTKLQTLVDINQINELKLKVGKAIGCGVVQQNYAGGDVKVLGKFSSQSINDLTTALESAVDQKAKQIEKITNEFLGGIGVSNSTDNTTRITNRITQIIQNTIQNINISEVITQVTAKQGNKLEYEIGEAICPPGAPPLVSQSNTAQIAAVVNVISDNISKNIIDDSVISRITQDITQESSIENKGPSFLLLLFILGIVFMLTFGGTYVATKVVNIAIKVLIVVAILSIIYLIVAYYRKWPPFQVKTPEYWSCIKDINGFVTRECRRVESREQGPFGSESQCKEAVEKGTAPCGQYWGCGITEGTYGKIYTGTCKQFNNAADGPYRTKNECDTANTGDTAICKNNFICPLDSAGLFVEPAICVPVMSRYVKDIKAVEELQCKQDMFLNCRNYWGIFTDDKGNKKCVAYRDKKTAVKDATTNDVVFPPDVFTKEDCEKALNA